jgi:hypothetical protein
MYKIKLSPYAKIFYTEWLLDPDSSRYNIPYVQILKGQLDVNKLRTALIKYISDHLLLNSHVQEINAEPCWVKNNNISELEYLDYPISDSDILNYITSKFDLYRGPLYRFRLIRIDKDVYKFIIVLQHLVVDGSSSDAGVQETISNYYNNRDYTAKYNLPEQIKLITDLENKLSINLEQNREEYKKFWHERLLDIENIDLSFLKTSTTSDGEVVTEISNPVEEIKFGHGKDELDKLNQIKSKYSITPYIYGQCIFAMLLHRYTGQKYFAINYPIAIRDGIDFIYGVQLNISFAPYKFNQDITVVELLDKARDFFRLIKQENIKYSYYPITELFGTLKGEINNGILNPNFSNR